MPDKQEEKAQRSIEEIRSEFSRRLDEILYRQISVDNIENFAESALDDLVVLNNDILREYRENMNFNSGAVSIDEQVQENKAYTAIGIPNVYEILELVEDKVKQIGEIKKKLKSKELQTDEVITPPQGKVIPPPGEDPKGWEKKEIFPRLLLLMYILENDLGEDLDSVAILVGNVEENSIRKEPYIRVEIPEQQRVVYICEEEDNVSYVFDADKIAELNLTLEELDVYEKPEKVDLISKNPGIGKSLRQSKHWRERMRELLENPIPVQTSQADTDEDDIGAVVVKSEFLDKKEYLPWDELVEEVREFFPGRDNVKDVKQWYRDEATKHKNWPSYSSLCKRKKYPQFTTMTEMLEIESKSNSNIDHLPWDELVKEVKKNFPGKDKVENVSAWYIEEKKKHRNWPDRSTLTAKIKYPKFITLAKILGIEHLPWDELVKEAREAFPGRENVLKLSEWYEKEQRQHENWPSLSFLNKKKYPQFISLTKMLDVESGSKKDVEHLSWGEFVKEVREIFPGREKVSNIEKWYRNEKKLHKNWPSHSNLFRRKIYPQFTTLSELLGLE